MEHNISIQHVDSRILLRIGSEAIEISDYKMQSSANEKTELFVTICGDFTEFELKASLEGPNGNGTGMATR